PTNNRSSVFSGISHYNGNMTTVNTPMSVLWEGNTVHIDGFFFNNIETNISQVADVLSLCCRFANSGFTVTKAPFQFKSGNGNPEGAIPGSTGSFYVNANGGNGVTLYVKESSPTATTGWRAVQTAAP